MSATIDRSTICVALPSAFRTLFNAFMAVRVQPEEPAFCGAVRAGLVRMLRPSGTSEFSGYREFTVDTAATYQPPKVP